MRRLAKWLYQGRGVILLVALVLLPLLGVLAAGAITKLSVGGFVDPEAESTVATDLLRDEFGVVRPPQIVIVATATSGSVDDEAAVAAGVELVTRLEGAAHVLDVTSYWGLLPPPDVELPIEVENPLGSIDGSEALVLVTLDAADDAEELERAGELADEIAEFDDSELTLLVGGAAEIQRQATEQAEKDLAKAEAISLPLTLIALVIVFGGVVAALLPLLLGIVAIIATLAVLNILTLFTDVSVFALNLTTALGLGLAIDYSLFIVSRMREERAGGRDVRLALSRTMQTAGRTVGFSAATVAISLSALWLFPTPYLQSFAFAGVAVVVIAAITAIIVLPAVLAVLGDRLEMWRIRKPRSYTSDQDGFWHNQARRVMRYPIRIAIGVSAFLLLLAVPFFSLESGSIDDRVLPEYLSSRQATEAIRRNFDSREGDALIVVALGTDASSSASEVDTFARDLLALDGVARVGAATGTYSENFEASIAEIELGDELFGTEIASQFTVYDQPAGTWLTVVPSVEPFSAEGEELARAVRGLDPGFPTIVGGPSAELVDSKDAVADTLPLALALIAVVTFVLLFMMTGSLLVPVKALLLNVLSLTATFGAMVWIFQDGHLSGVLGFTPTGFIDTSTPILMFCLAFGLSMDYEVFVLSRIKEEYDLTGDNSRAVAVGLQKTGSIVTAAAALLAIVFLGIATSSVSIVKMLGIGMTLAVVVDAFFIRATLMPALMQLAGRANWWAPRFLRRFHLRFGIFESDPIELLDIDDESESTPFNAPSS